MTMPAGKKFSNGYCSISKIDNAKNYSQVSQACGKQGFKIGPSNVRNVLLSAMKKIVLPICETHNLKLSEEQITKIIKNPDFQLSVASLIAEE